MVDKKIPKSLVWQMMGRVKMDGVMYMYHKVNRISYVKVNQMLCFKISITEILVVAYKANAKSFVIGIWISVGYRNYPAIQVARAFFHFFLPAFVPHYFAAPLKNPNFHPK